MRILAGGPAAGKALFCEAPGHVRGIGLPVVKGLAILAFLSFPLPVAARFFAKRLAMGGAEGGPVVRARGAHCKTASHLACAEHWLSGGFAACGFTLCQRRAACATGQQQMARQSLRRWLSAQPFCRARPVRAPLAGECLRTWQALRKEARGPARGRRKARRFHIPFPSNPVATRSPISWQRSWSSRLVSCLAWSG